MLYNPCWCNLYWPNFPCQVKKQVSQAKFSIFRCLFKFIYIYIPTDWKLECLFGKFRPDVQNWKIAFYQHFRSLNASPSPRMKLFGNQQLECLQGYIFFQAETHIYPRPSKSPKKNVVYHIIFIILEFFQGIWRFWVYECTCLRISHYFLCTLQFGVLFYSLSPFDNLDKSEFPVQKLRFWTHTWGRQASGKRGHTQPLMVLNRQLECGFSKGSPSLINTFVLSPRWAASWNACNCHWLEKMFICFS